MIKIVKRLKMCRIVNFSKDQFQLDMAPGCSEVLDLASIMSLLLFRHNYNQVSTTIMN